MLLIPNRRSSSHSPLARPSAWPTGSSCAPTASTPPTWARSSTVTSSTPRKCTTMTSSISQTRTTAKRWRPSDGDRQKTGTFSGRIERLLFCVFNSLAVRGEAERWESGCGDRRVRLGLHPAHRHPGQHAQQWPGGPIGETQCRWPDHVHQRHQSCWAATRHLSGHHKGTSDKSPLYSSMLTSSSVSVLLAYLHQVSLIHSLN